MSGMYPDTKTGDAATAAIIAALYVVLGVTFQPIGWGAWQMRIAQVLIPLIGWLPGALPGVMVGHIAFNYLFPSPMIPWDYFSPFVFLPARLLIWKYGDKALPLHIASIAVYVGWMITITFGGPLWFNILTIIPGESLAELYLGRILSKQLRDRI